MKRKAQKKSDEKNGKKFDVCFSRALCDITFTFTFSRSPKKIHFWIRSSYMCLLRFVRHKEVVLFFPVCSGSFFRIFATNLCQCRMYALSHSYRLVNKFFKSDRRLLFFLSLRFRSQAKSVGNKSNGKNRPQ